LQPRGLAIHHAYARVLVEEESNSSKAGNSPSSQARLALSIKTKVLGIFEGGNLSKNGHTFAAIDGYDKWVSTGLKRGFRYQVEDAVKALEATLSRKTGLHYGHKNNVHSIFLTLLNDSTQHVLKLHHMIDGQFFGTELSSGLHATMETGSLAVNLRRQFLQAPGKHGLLTQMVLVKQGTPYVQCVYGMLYKLIGYCKDTLSWIS
jgi:hypothetical protein